MRAFTLLECMAAVVLLGADRRDGGGAGLAVGRVGASTRCTLDRAGR
ncbi:MAG: prepilin-type N-terminal cleavage/methylation domain-containing protein [Planctomycetota bacterium]|nr:MAG: prepilin-type N-terminal cleavage/methylation domain-containing protein [Planctomycetota bacterium]